MPAIKEMRLVCQQRRPNARGKMVWAGHWFNRLVTRLQTLERARSEPIAIVGMACRFPGGANDPPAAPFGEEIERAMPAALVVCYVPNLFLPLL